MAELACVFCKEKPDGKEKKFTTDNLRRCEKVLNYRRQKPARRKSIYSEIELPPNIESDKGYHSHCYKNFTAVKLPKETTVPEQNVADSSTSADTINEMDNFLREGSSTSRASEQVEEQVEENPEADDSTEVEDSEDTSACIICDKIRITVKGRTVRLSKGTEAFVNYMESIAIQYSNEDMLEKMRSQKEVGDLYYHSSCKTKFAWSCEKQMEERKESAWHGQRKCHTDAYDQICCFVRKHVVENNECLFFSFVSERYVQFLREEYANTITATKPDSFCARNLEKKLVATFNEEIKVIYSNNKKYIAPYAGQIISNQEFFENMETRQAIYNIGKIIRKEILNMDKTKLPEDITVQDLIRGECDSVPQLLLYLLECIVCGDSKSMSRTRHEDRKSFRELKLFSLGQDIIYAASNASVKTSKHVTLGMALKSLSSSRKIVDLVNRYGHCCSYHVIEELETELTFSSTKQNLLCPEDIIRTGDLCTGIAFDNFDRFVDTLTGKDTLHDTVGIIYQNVSADTTNSGRTAEASSQTGNNVTGTGDTAASNNETSRGRKRRRCFDPILHEIEPYKKKPKIESSFAVPSTTELSVKPEVFEKWRNVDLAWLLSHKLEVSNTPMWTGYNSLITEDNSPLQKVSYLTPINASPTDNSVVYVTLKMAQQIAEECNSQYMQVTYDLAIARIAFGIQSQEAPRFDNIFIHLGGFHIMLSYFKAVGTFIEDCGLTNVMVDSEILANGSLRGFITGTNFNRCKRLHPLLSLALQKLHFDAFLDHEQIVIGESVADFLLQFQSNRSAVPEIDHEETLQLFAKYDNYTEQTLQGQHGKTAQFYAIYVQLVSYYQILNKSIRTGDLKMYIYILAKIASLFFAFNHQNYCRWLVYYVCKLSSIDETHPGLRVSLEQGSFGVRRTAKPFSRIPVDLTLEQTINGEAARRLIGIIHMTNSISARQRWAINHSSRARITSHVLQTTGLAKNQDISAELKGHRIRKSVQQVERFTRTLHEYVNPFDNTLDRGKLYNVTTGEAVPANVADFLLNVEAKGQMLRDNFIDEIKESPARFHAPIKKNPVATFSSIKKKKTVKLGGKVTELRLQRDLFGRLLALALERRISIEKALRFPITPTPLSLSHPDGTPNKTDKSAMMRDLEKLVESREPKSTDVLIIDGFFLLHTLKDIPKTFGDFSKKLLRIVCNTDAARVDLIFDRYFTPSIKDTEHTLRENVNSMDFRITGPHQIRPANFGKELKNIRFKEALVKFLIGHWSEPEMVRIIGDKTVNVNHDMCYQYRVENGSVKQTVDESLTCQEHEEADTKIVYHACQLTERGSLTIRCSDTDILIIMLGNVEFLKATVSISMDVGVGNSRRFIDVSRLHEVLGLEVARCLPSVHAMTGCDFNPAFHRKGKKKSLTMLRNSTRYQEAFAKLGASSSDTNDVFDILEEFTCRLYNQKKINDVDSARMEIFTKTYEFKGGYKSTLTLNLSNYDACNLPPCKSELRQHFLRTQYIAQIWCNAHKKIPTTLEATDFGWSIDEGRYGFTWFTGAQLPELGDIVFDDESTSTRGEDADEPESDLDSDVDDCDGDESDSD